MKRALVLLAVGTACSKPVFTEPLKLAGDKVVAPETLNEGQIAYTHYCTACHGEKGDGQGPAAPGMRPAPRDFHAALFKFGAVEIGQLPNDEDLVEVIARGLDGTPMLPWDISDRERHAIVQYIKTFSPRWAEEAPGERITPTPDPWVGREAEAIEVGKRIYHLSGVEKDASGGIKYVLAGCGSCHPSYLSRQELTAMASKTLGQAPATLADEMYRPSLKGSEYTAGAYQLQILPIDFLFHRVKNGSSLTQLYRTIAAGIAGAAMPTWKNVLNEEGLWALVHYVKSLVDMRGTPAALALRAALAAQPRELPPPPPAEPAVKAPPAKPTGKAPPRPPARPSAAPPRPVE